MLRSILRLAATKEVSDFTRLVSTVESRMKSIEKLSKQMAGSSDSKKAESLWAKVEKDVSSVMDAAVRMHKKLSGTTEFSTLGKSIRNVELAVDAKSDVHLLAFQASQVSKAVQTVYGDMYRITALAKSGYLE